MVDGQVQIFLGFLLQWEYMEGYCAQNDEMIGVKREFIYNNNIGNVGISTRTT